MGAVPTGAGVGWGGGAVQEKASDTLELES